MRSLIKLAMGAAAGAFALAAAAAPAHAMSQDEIAAALSKGIDAIVAGQTCDMTAGEVLAEFIPIFFEQRNATLAFETWVHEDYINHNPFAQTGRDAAVAFLQPFFDSNPDARYIVHRVIAGDEFVAVHNEARFTPDGQPSAVVDIFRVVDCKIVEHWDVIQTVPEQSANENTMF